MQKIKTYFWNVLIAVDQAANTVLGGDPDETISSRAAKRQHEQKWACLLCRFLHWIDKNHCPKSIELDEGSREVIR